MENMDMTRRRFVGVIAFAVIIALVAGVALTFTGFRINEAVSASESYYTYNIDARIISISSIFMPWRESDPFRYVVTVEIPENAEPVVLSEAPHVLPNLDPGYHAVLIPDSDILGYIDWHNSDTDPIESEGARVRVYTLYPWVKEKTVTLSCHEVLGSSGHAELVCSEF